MRTRNALLALAAGLMVAGVAAAHPKPTPEERQALFTQADADGDGKLSAAEFATLHDLRREQMAAKRFAALDTDHDGFVSQTELDAGMARRHHGKCGPGGGQ